MASVDEAILNFGGEARQGSTEVFEAVDFFYCLLFMITVWAIDHGYALLCVELSKFMHSEKIY